MGGRGDRADSAGLTHSVIRFVTHFDVDETDVERLIGAMRDVLAE